jgi:hypothetical protein
MLKEWQQIEATNGDNMTNSLFTNFELEGILHLANSDEGMKDLLLQVKEYYYLKGMPKGPKLFRDPELKDERNYRIMNTPYGL